jgi:PrtD family type I secretion system ABC transporter
MGRALGPVEQAVGQWKGFQSARGAYQRIRSMLLAVPTSRNVMALPRPDGVITVQNVIAAPPGARVPVLKNVTFQLQPGEVVGVIGPSAAGKSTLARVVLGIWPAASGTVRIDGAELSQWEPEDLGQYVGYLPQDVELFDGTISENISRFADPVDSAGVIAAAKKAGVHEMVLLMPEGYNTQIGAGGAALSGGQRQRVGLARALYGNPVLVVLDEPNSNLDAEGENALAQAILAMKQENRTILVITHRLQLLAAVDKVMVMNSGAVEAMGPRDEVLARYTRPTVVANNPQVTQNASSEPPASDNAAEGA